MVLQNTFIKHSAFLFFVPFVLTGCDKNEEEAPAAAIEVPAVYKKIYGAGSITSDGTLCNFRYDIPKMIEFN